MGAGDIIHRHALDATEAEIAYNNRVQATIEAAGSAGFVAALKVGMLATRGSALRLADGIINGTEDYITPPILREEDQDAQ